MVSTKICIFVPRKYLERRQRAGFSSQAARSSQLAFYISRARQGARCSLPPQQSIVYRTCLCSCPVTWATIFAPSSSFFVVPNLAPILLIITFILCLGLPVQIRIPGLYRYGTAIYFDLKNAGIWCGPDGKHGSGRSSSTCGIRGYWPRRRNSDHARWGRRRYIRGELRWRGHSGNIQWPQRRRY